MVNTKKLLKRKKYNNIKSRKNKNKKRTRKVHTHKGGFIIPQGYRNTKKNTKRNTGNKHRYHRFGPYSSTNLRKSFLAARGILNTGASNKKNQNKINIPIEYKEPILYKSPSKERNTWAKKFFLYNNNKNNKGSRNSDLVLISPELKRLMNRKTEMNLRSNYLKKRRTVLLSKKKYQ